MFGLSKEEAEAIVERKICKMKTNGVFPTYQAINNHISSTPCPPPVYIYYAAVEVSHNVASVVVVSQVKGKESWTDPLCGIVWAPLRKKPFLLRSDAYEWIIKNEKTISKEFPLGVGVRIYALSKKLSKVEGE